MERPGSPSGELVCRNEGVCVGTGGGGQSGKTSVTQQEMREWGLESRGSPDRLVHQCAKGLLFLTQSLLNLAELLKIHSFSSFMVEGTTDVRRQKLRGRRNMDFFFAERANISKMKSCESCHLLHHNYLLIKKDILLLLTFLMFSCHLAVYQCLVQGSHLILQQTSNVVQLIPKV